MTTTTNLEQIDRILVTPEFRDDPHAVYARLRETEPVFRSRSLGQWLVTSREHVMTLLHDTDVYSNYGWELARLSRLPREVIDRVPRLERMTRTPVVVFSDPPIHTRLRKQVVRTFTPRSVEGSRSWVGELIDELMGAPAEGEPFDVVERLAFPLPLRVVAHLFGARDADVTLYKEVSSTRLLFQGTPTPDAEIAQRLDGLLVRFADHLDELFESLRADPDSGLLSALLTADETGDRLDPDELFHTCVVFLSAGHETTTALISNAVLALIRNPDQQELVRADPSLIPALIEEVMRWVSPVQRVLRVARVDTELGGKQITAGDVVVAILASANRDPAHYLDPDRFDLARPDAGHVAFGHGIHFCVGAGLARLEATMALQRFLELFPEPRLPDGWTPEWVNSVSIRTLESLPVLPR